MVGLERPRPVEEFPLNADIAFNHDIPDAEMRVISIHAGPDAESLEQLTFIHESDPPAADSGTVELQASLFDAGAFDRADFEPPIAGDTSKDITVAVKMEVERANGQTVTETKTETVTVTIRDGTELEAGVGGQVDITVTEA